MMDTKTQHEIRIWGKGIAMALAFFVLCQGSMFAASTPNLESMTLSELQEYYKQVDSLYNQACSNYTNAKNKANYYYSLAQRYKNSNITTYNMYMRQSISWEYKAADYANDKQIYIKEKDRVQAEINRRQNNPSTEYTISAIASPSSGGTVSGAGKYKKGEPCTLTATANSGYKFSYWAKNGSQVSTNPTYSFTVNANVSYTAYFTKAAVTYYTISATASPSAGGTVSGAGNYEKGKPCTLTATANSGYKFSYWAKNGSQVSTSTTYSFTVNANASYTAYFKKTIVPEPPTPSASTTNTSYVYVSWSGVSGATRYAVRRGTSSTYSNSTQLGTTTNAYYYDYSATPGVKYYYWVNTVASDGTEYYNTGRYDWGMRKVGSIPEPPTPSASTSYTSYIRVSWSAVSGATKYVIRRNTTSDYNSSIQLSTTTSTYYYDYSATPGVKYYYWVNTVSSTGSQYYNASRYDWGKRVSLYLVPPTPYASITYTSYIRISWDSVPGATKYVIHRGTTTNYSASVQIGTTSNTYFYDSAGFSGVKYYYWVNPVDSSGVEYYDASKYDWGRKL